MLRRMNDPPVSCIVARAICLADDLPLATWARSLPEDDARLGVEALEAHADRLAEHPAWAKRPIQGVLVDAVIGLATRNADTHRPSTWTRSGGYVPGDLILPKWEAAARELMADAGDERLLELYATYIEESSKRRLEATA